jgi:hypothetical protein
VIGARIMPTDQSFFIAAIKGVLGNREETLCDNKGSKGFANV